MVEARGVEPLSENTSPWASPGADDLFTFPLPCAARQAHGFSSFIVHGALKALRAHVHHLVTPTSRAVVLPGRTAALVTQQQVQYYRYLIYKLQFLKRPAPLPAAHVSASPSKPVRPHDGFSITAPHSFQTCNRAIHIYYITVHRKAQGLIMIRKNLDK